MYRDILKNPPVAYFRSRKDKTNFLYILEYLFQVKGAILSKDMNSLKKYLILLYELLNNRPEGDALYLKPTEFGLIELPEDFSLHEWGQGMTLTSELFHPQKTDYAIFNDDICANIYAFVSEIEWIADKFPLQQVLEYIDINILTHINRDIRYVVESDFI